MKLMLEAISYVGDPFIHMQVLIPHSKRLKHYKFQLIILWNDRNQT